VPLSTDELDAYLARAEVAVDVWELRPDYRAMLIAVDGIEPGASDHTSEALLEAAEVSARAALTQTAVEDLPHVAAWREAYRAFGAKPQRTRNSLEALLRRAESGLPRVNRLTDIYNSISVSRQLPLGGEDLSRYDGPPRLVRATGSEPFDTTADGAEVIEHPEPGEVVWRDDAGVTCRRWNWRQARRTQLHDGTTSALFIIDVLDPVTQEELAVATEELIELLRSLGPDVRVAQRMLGRA
jgi:DNA/RNA-binding domain of Phe-tRNA-synthetase-like protein